VGALAGKKVIDAAASEGYTAAWTDGGELFTFGRGGQGRLGHGGTQAEHVPRLVEALAGKKLINIGASVRGVHMAVWTDAGELFTFEQGNFGRLGHAGRGMC